MVPEHQQKEMLESLVKFYGCEEEVRPTRLKFGKLYRASHDATSNQAYNRQVVAKSAAEGVLKLAEEALEKAQANIAANKKLKESADLAAEIKKGEARYFSKAAL